MTLRRHKAVVSVRTTFGVMRTYEDDHITQQLVEFGAHTRPEFAFLSSIVSSGDRILDIGAHIGTFTVPLAQRMDPSGVVVAVEAQSENFTLLLENLRLNGVTERVVPLKAAVAPRHRSYSLSAHSNNSGTTRLVPRKVLPWIKPVLVTSIDEIVSATTVPDLIKIDIEGLELAVLEDSTTVREHRPVLYAEISEPQLSRYGSDVESFDRFLRRLDYRLFRNVGDRNAAHDNFTVAELRSLSGGDVVFDVLAVPPGNSWLARMPL